MRNRRKGEFLSTRVQYISLSQLTPNPQQPRRSFDEAAAELLFLGVPRQTLCQRIQWAEGGERH